MGISAEEFNALTPAEFIYAWMGWNAHQTSLSKQSWERERWAVWVATCIQLDKKDRADMTEMFPLPWECQAAHAINELTMTERRERVNKILNQK
ncbi:MAG: hypothetical protein SNG81_04290 [Rikenellaceae bacterium]